MGINAQRAADKAKDEKIKAYSATLDYLAGLIATHNGLNGWTEAEYQRGRRIAEGTKSDDFLATVDWAWNHKEIDQISRLTKVMQEVSKGIDDNLK